MVLQSQLETTRSIILAFYVNIKSRIFMNDADGRPSEYRRLSLRQNW